MNTQSSNIEQTSTGRAYVALVQEHGEQFASLIAFSVFFRDVIVPALAGNDDALLAIREDLDSILGSSATLLAGALSSVDAGDVKEALEQMSAAMDMVQIVGVAPCSGV